MLSKALEDFIFLNLDEMRYPGFTQKRKDDIKRYVNNVSKGKGWQEVTNCPLCDSAQKEVIFRRCDIDIVQCLQCGCGYGSKFPVDTSDVYSDESYLPACQSDYLENVEYRKQRFGKERLKLIATYLNKPLRGSRLLDVGCGTGWFLEIAKENGYEVFGQEWGKELASFTSNRLNIQVWNEPLTEIPKIEKFDVITLFDVLEHVPNPKQVLHSIKDHLTDAGTAVLFVPNLDSLGFWKLKEKACMVTPAEHLFYFTENALKRVLGKIGFSVLYFETKGMDIPDLYAFYRDEARENQIAEFLKEHCNTLQAIVDQAGCANHMRFIIKKNDEN